MLQTNLLTGDANKVQVVMDNGDKVLLNYYSNDSNDDTTWIGSYILPASTNAGNHNYTVEASHAFMETDIPTHFNSPPSNSSNTGINVTGTITVLATPSTTITGSSKSSVKGISTQETSTDKDKEKIGSEEGEVIEETNPEKNTLFLTIGETNYTVTIDILSNITVAISIGDKTFNLDKGTSKEIDVNNDNVFDLKVTLNDIKNNNPILKFEDLTIKKEMEIYKPQKTNFLFVNFIKNNPLFLIFFIITIIVIYLLIKVKNKGINKE